MVVGFRYKASMKPHTSYGEATSLLGITSFIGSMPNANIDHAALIQTGRTNKASCPSQPIAATSKSEEDTIKLAIRNNRTKNGGVVYGFIQDRKET